MDAIYLAIVAILFLLAISDLVVGVSNDAVNFLNSAVGAKAATFRTILIVAALGIIVGCTFSSGMMEVARKGIFHPEHFSFAEIMVLFLAVMITDVILLDSFNTLGMPTSTTVSIVFELLGASVAIAAIKIYTDPNALSLGEYINTGKALAIISGILLSVIVAFTAGVIIQYLTRLLFSFDYEKRLKYVGSVWGGMSIAAITYFILVKGAKGASFMSAEVQTAINDNALAIIGASFIGWTLVLQLVTWFSKVDVFKFIVLVGTFALAMAFASNDLVNFIGVPLAGYNSYELFQQAGGQSPELFGMRGLAGQVATPTLFLLLAGVIMTVTLWTSKKARSVIKTSVDLGRQYDGAERFDSYAVSRSIVRGFGKMAIWVNQHAPKRWRNHVDKQFDEQPFTAKQVQLGAEAPAFDMVRAAVTLVMSSIVISLGTALKLPLSTTYVTFMVFMGASLADGAWGRESAVYRVSGVLSVIGGWFFTAFSAFTVCFIVTGILYFGGMIGILIMLLVTAVFLYRSHRYHGKKVEEQAAFEKAVVGGVLTRAQVVGMSVGHVSNLLNGVHAALEDTLNALQKEKLSTVNKAHKRLKRLQKQAAQLHVNANRALDKIEDDEIEAGHFYILVVEYLWEITRHAGNIVKPSLDHIDNHHKPLLRVQIEELKTINSQLKEYADAIVRVFENLDGKGAVRLMGGITPIIRQIRTVRKNQIKRIKNHEIGTRNSLLYLNHLGEFRNLVLFANRLVAVYHDLILNPEPETATKPAPVETKAPPEKTKKPEKPPKEKHTASSKSAAKSKKEKADSKKTPKSKPKKKN